MSILVSGSLVYDHIMNFPDSFKNHIMPENIHILNVCFSVDKLERSWGGTAGNIVYTLKLLGGEPVLVSAVGRDGVEYTEYFNKLGVKTDFVQHDTKQLTASAYITTDADDNQIAAFYGGPLSWAKEVDIKKAADKVTLALISPTPKEVMIKHIKECSELGIKTVFDPGQQITSFTEGELKRAISQAYFVVGNDYELKLLEQKTGWDTDEILKNTKVLIITLGEKGSVVVTASGERVEIGACAPQSFDDPTGAGDAYRAGFFTGYELGYNWKMCGQMGAVAAAYAIETYGTQAHTFTKAEFCARYEQAFKEKINF